MRFPNCTNWPQYSLGDLLAVSQTLLSNQLFAAERVANFESDFKTSFNCDFALGVGNATQGLHLALSALDIGIGDEVIVTPYSWISSASCILMQNAIPIFCDIETDTFGLDPSRIEELITPQTKAVIAVHMFGYPCKIEEIKLICKKHNLYLVEDNSHALGSTVSGNFTGTFGDISVVSLHQRKALSVGDGGIVSTNNPKYAETIYKQRSFGHTELSYNYRMTEFAAALGSSRITRLNSENNLRSNRADFIKQSLSDVVWLNPLEIPKTTHAVFYAVLLVITTPLSPARHKKLIELTKQFSNIFRFTWKPLHKHPHFRNDGVAPARGRPWDLSGRFVDDQTPWGVWDLPITNEFIPDRVLEFYVHPTINNSLIKHICARIKSI